MSRRFIGIDPGKYGALASISESGEVIQVFDCPLKGSGELDVPALVRMVQAAASGADRVCIESVHSTPNDGHVGAFSFGMNFGVWLAALAAAGIEPVRVNPQRWMATMIGNRRLTGRRWDKKPSLSMARQLFPAVDLSLAKHDGRADALLIADYCRRSARLEAMILKGERRHGSQAAKLADG